jgi:alpha-tubulin suppressor-like RCC1 family protein
MRTPSVQWDKPQVYIAFGILCLFCLAGKLGAAGFVAVWGDNAAGETNTPPDLTNAISISAGGEHTLALNADGTVTAWGFNDSGECNVPAGLNNAIAVAAGWDHSLALLSDGTVVAWGGNLSGETNVPSGLNGVVAIAAGGCNCAPNANKSLALKRNGTVVGWGGTKVPTGLSNIVAISAGNKHCLALKGDGTIVGWGTNVHGEAVAPAGLSNVIAISAGGAHSLALRADGTVFAWGDNTYSQTNLPAGLSNIIAIAAGDNFSLALNSSGMVFGWGAGTRPIGSYPNFGQAIVPAYVSNVMAISAAWVHSVALQHDNSPYFLSQPSNQTLFSGATLLLNPAVAGVSPILFQWQLNGVDVAGATNRSLVLVNVQLADSGSYTLIASNSYGVTISSNANVAVVESSPVFLAFPTNQAVPAGTNANFTSSVAGSLPINLQWSFNDSDIPAATNMSLIIPGAQFANAGRYALMASNLYGTASATARLDIVNVVAWGAGTTNSGQGVQFGQSIVPNAANNVVAIAGGGYDSLALRQDGKVLVWGNGTTGQTNVSSSATNVTALAAGRLYAMALRADGTVIQWGQPPASVPSAATNVTAIAEGWNFSLALRGNGTVVGWGENSYGPVTIPLGLSNITAVAAGNYHGLALRTNGTVAAWGAGTFSGSWPHYGQSLVPIGLSNVVAVAGGGYHSLALKRDGSVVAWGLNFTGQTNVPQGLTNIVAIAAGGSNSLALAADGKLIAWGDNSYALTNIYAGLTNIISIAAGQSHNLVLVNDGSIAISLQPVSRTVTNGTPVVFRVGAFGPPPLIYQWQFNGTNLIGATSASLVLTNPQPADAGNYEVIVSNPVTSISSSNAMLTVLTVPPAFTLQPTNQVVAPGGDAVFVASAIGSPPINYQWQFRGTDVAGATSTKLTLTNVQPANEGVYTVIASNSFGVAVSLMAYLDVQSLAEALNATNLIWSSTSTSMPWLPETTFTHDGIAAASCSSTNPLSQGILKTSVTGPGTLTFWWALLLKFGGANLLFSMNGTNAAMLGFPQLWQQQTFYLWEGTNDLQWMFPADQFFNSGSTTGFVDQVTYTPGATSAFIVSAPPSSLSLRAGTNFTFSVVAAGTPPLRYQWFFNGLPIPAATGNNLLLTNVQAAVAGNYSAIVSNSYGVTNIASTLDIIPSGPWFWSQPVSHQAVRNGNCVFSSFGAGSEPLNYQWLYNGDPIAGATDSQLILRSIKTNAQGFYSLALSNAYGVTTSTNAALVIVPSLLIAWGDDFFGQSSVPALSNVTAFAGGWDYSMAVNGDGNIISWGYSMPSFSPAPTGVVAVAAGATYSLALRKNGTVVGAGTSVPQSLSNVVAISAGDSASLALRNDGTVVAWGNNALGQTNIPLVLSNNVVAIASGWEFDAALTREGRIVAWGGGIFGGTSVPPWLKDVVGIGAGWYHGLAVKADGTITGWGDNGFGQARAPTNATNVVAVAGGVLHSLALKEGGTLVAWGDGPEGQTAVPIIATNVVAIACGSDHCLALLGDGSLTILRQPWSRTILNGSTVPLNVGAVGNGTLHYQWRFNGTTLPGATAATLWLVAATTANAGNYDVVVTNSLGSVTSAVANVTVQVPRPTMQANGPALGFTNGAFAFRVQGPQGLLVIIEASTDLISWLPLQTNALINGQIIFNDAQANSFPKRFYRARFAYAFLTQPLLQPSAFGESSLPDKTGFVLNGSPGQVAVIEGSSNFLNWVPLQTNTLLTGRLYFNDPLSATLSARFYRARLQ